MRHTVSIFKAGGDYYLQSGYRVRLYAWSSGSSGYSGQPLHIYKDNGDGTYHANITTTIKGTLVITSPMSSIITVPNNYIGFLFQGNNQPTIPRVSS